jgi:hypothetical protein
MGLRNILDKHASATYSARTKLNMHCHSFPKTGRAALGPVGWSSSELAVTASAIVARFGVFVDASAIIARLRVLVEATAIISWLRMPVDAAAIIAWLRMAVEATAIIAWLRMPVEATAIVAPLRLAPGRDGHSGVAALAATVAAGPFSECG